MKLKKWSTTLILLTILISLSITNVTRADETKTQLNGYQKLFGQPYTILLKSNKFITTKGEMVVYLLNSKHEMKVKIPDKKIDLTLSILKSNAKGIITYTGETTEYRVKLDEFADNYTIGIQAKNSNNVEDVDFFILAKSEKDKKEKKEVIDYLTCKNNIKFYNKKAINVDMKNNTEKKSKNLYY